MEPLNTGTSAQNSGIYLGDYGDASVSSMMALIAQGESQSAPLHSCFNSFYHRGGIFEAERPQRQSFSSLLNSESTAAGTVCSMPLVKTEKDFPDISTPVEFHREKCFTEPASVQMVSSALASLASQESRSAKEEEEMEAVKAKILGHPRYPCVLEAYVNCQKVGAPPEIVARLDEACKDQEDREANASIGMDPELDGFMEAYCGVLSKYEEELTKPLKEAMAFIKKIETQLNSLTKGTIKIFPSAESDDKTEGGGSSDEEDCSTAEQECQEVDQNSQDRELKDRLLRKYSGYLSNLKQEFMKKKKKGKLPKEARQKLLDWWDLHNKWPYPSALTSS